MPRKRGKTPEELANILGNQLDQFLKQCAGVVTRDTIGAICDLVKANVMLMDRMKETEGEAEKVKPAYAQKNARVAV